MDTTCVVCGGKDFSVINGFYYCNECQTQSQGDREQVQDEIITTAIATQLHRSRSRSTSPASDSSTVSSKRKRKQKKKIPKRELCMPEMLTIAIKTWVKHLVELGVDRSLEDCVLKLWCLYINQMGGCNQPEKKIARKKYVQQPLDEKDANDPDNPEGIDPLGQLKADDLRDKNQTGQAEGDHFHDNDQSVPSETKHPEDRTQPRQLDGYYSHCKDQPETYPQNRKQPGLPETDNFLNKDQSNLAVSDSEEEVDDHDVTKPVSVMWMKRGIHGRELTFSRAFSIVCLGVLLVDSVVQLSNIIRWCREGHLPVYTLSSLIPCGCKFDLNRCTKAWQLGYYYLSVQSDIYFLMQKMKLRQLRPTPLLPIVRRIVAELCLPEKMAVFAVKLITSLGRTPIVTIKNPGRGTCSYIANPEGRAAALVLVSLKLLFGLDGATEERLSSLARHLNRQREAGDSLFVFSDWIRYVQARRFFMQQVDGPTLMNAQMEHKVVCSPRHNNLLTNFFMEVVESWKPTAVAGCKGVVQSSTQKLFKHLQDTSESSVHPPSLYPTLHTIRSYVEGHREHSILAKSKLLKLLKLGDVVAKSDFRFLQEKSRKSHGKVVRGAATPRIPLVTLADISMRQTVKVKFDDAQQEGEMKQELCNINDSTETERAPRRSRKDRRLYAAAHDLWHIPFVGKREAHRPFPRHYFDDISCHFPDVFRFLLCEISDLIEMRPADLYVEVIIIEKMITDGAEETNQWMRASFPGVRLSDVW